MPADGRWDLTRCLQGRLTLCTHTGGHCFALGREGIFICFIYCLLLFICLSFKICFVIYFINTDYILYCSICYCANTKGLNCLIGTLKLNNYFKLIVQMVYPEGVYASQVIMIFIVWVRLLSFQQFVHCTGADTGVLISPQPDQEGNKLMFL